ncbi:MAG: hypothetical protein HUJ31_16425, partial [Pseudomonadales bacterium]|nr:hypothetical protein [Pseudomonadales bacterium]
MAIYYSLIFTVFFDLILLLSLSHYHRRLGYNFLKFGSLALGLEIVSQIAFYASLSVNGALPLVIGSIARMLFSALLLACIYDIMSRRAPLGLMLAGIITCLVIVIVEILLSGTFGLYEALLAKVPAIGLLAWGVVLLLRSRTGESVGVPCLAGLLVLYIGMEILMPLVVASDAFPVVSFFDAVIVMMIAVAMLMMTSEMTFTNLGVQKRRIEEYKQQTDRLEWQFSQASKLESLGMLAGGIAHDFNNMLTSILGYASLAMRKLPAESEVREDLYMVMSGARQAVDLTSQMLIYAGKGAIEFEAVDISKIVENMSSLMQSVVPRKIRLAQDIARGLPVLKGDKAQLGQVVMNLTANAVDAIEGDSGTIEVSTGLADVDEQLLKNSFFASTLSPGAYLYLKVSDDGIGMQENQIGRIFDPFYSEKSSNKGLGLSSLSGIVRQHGGFINVVSAPGEGSQFTVYFPVISYGELPTGRPEEMQGASNGHKKNILVAEDDAKIRSLIVSILAREDYDITLAEDGREAAN